MANRTPDFNACLKQREASPVVKQHYDLQKINTFLQDAYSINARIADLTRELRAIRPLYLSTVPARRRHLAETSSHDHDRAQPLTDKERDSLDAQSKQLLRQLNGAISGLQQAEEVRVQAAESVALSKRARGGLGAIGRWAAGGAVTAKSPEEEREEAERESLASFRKSVIIFLQQRLEQAGRVQGEMMEVRLGREVEKSKSVLSKARVAGKIPYAEDVDETDVRSSEQKSRNRRSAGLSGDFSDVATSSAPQELSQDQLQLFAEENADLLKHYEDQLDQVRTAERSILEISELHSTLHANLQQQSEHIEQLVQDSYLTTENLGKGNKELKKASERRSTAQAVFWGTVGFCSFLVVWDLVF